MLSFRELLERLFHVQKWLPPEVDRYAGKSYALKFTAHAIEAAKNDRYGQIDLNKIKSVTIEKNRVIEVETDDLTGQIRKFVLRIPYDEKKDVVVVFVVPEGVVKTLWFNLKSDQHRTVNLRRYADKPGAR